MLVIFGPSSLEYVKSERRRNFAIKGMSCVSIIS